MIFFRFKDEVKAGEEAGIILRLSDEIRITPVLTAKFILEGYILEQQELRLKESQENYHEDESTNKIPSESKDFYFYVKITTPNLSVVCIQCNTSFLR